MSNEYLDRDISWLAFNERVSDETKKKIPLAEKVMFHGIVFSNLNEFMQVRYPAKVEDTSTNNLDELIKELSHHYQRMCNRFDKFNQNYKLIHTVNSLNKDLTKWCEDYFISNVFPCLQPITVNKNSKPYFHSGMYLIVKLDSNHSEEIGYVEISDKLNRFIKVNNKNFVITLEDLIQSNIGQLFRNRKINTWCIITIHRSAEVYIQPNYYMTPYDMIKQTLAEREKSWITYIEISHNNKDILKIIQNIIPVVSNTIIFETKMTSIMDLKDFPNIFDSKDQFRKFNPIKTFPTGSIFDYIKQRDRLAFHPYESYETSFVRFIQESAEDKDVVSIKISLYRVSSHSKIIDALLKAADQGKIVTALIELKARFDEHHNIEISNILREGGVRIVYTKPDIKTHAKVCLVTRNEKKGLRIYSHIGTGNYSESNSKLYTDYSYFTANQKIGTELSKFFNLLTSDQEPFKSKEIVYAPYNMRDVIMDNIDEQIKLAKNHHNGRIFFKCNALTDDKIANKIIDAAKNGVKVILFIRSACVIEPQDNIKIFSVVGRFLEHSRLYVFGYGKNSKMYIGSADLMFRNLSRRNELMILVEQKDIRERLLKHLQMYMKDNVNKRKIEKQYKYKTIIPDKNEKPYNVQDEFIKEAKDISNN